MKNCRTLVGSLSAEGYSELRDWQALGVDGSIYFKLSYYCGLSDDILKIKLLGGHGTAADSVWLQEVLGGSRALRMTEVSLLVRTPVFLSHVIFPVSCPTGSAVS